ncbi:hypothetical protein Clacol_001728 [Clathrus columnatus]|uniref:Uncharacterized protein n=1 Tax=Clathrus columnatus TaxID=1419009 RepID=A0AAV5A3D1_9AGAM|nr:hypothetical protein Clacol_001728 [Clathrus columnatus]
MIIPPCEDEPPEPDEQTRSLVSPDESAFLWHSRALFILQCEVKTQASSKLESRSGHSSSLISIHIIHNDRYIPQRLSIVWKKALNSLEYFPLSRELSAVAKIRTQEAPVPRISPYDSVDAIDDHVSKNLSSDIVPKVSALGETFCIPTIIITPPPETSDGAVNISCNAVPMPQDSGSGAYLTVPDFDSKVTNNWHGCERRRVTTVGRSDVLVNHEGSSRKVGAYPKFDITTSRNYAFLDDEDEEPIDLGPTWCG